MQIEMMRFDLRMVCKWPIKLRQTNKIWWKNIITQTIKEDKKSWLTQLIYQLR